MKICRNELMSNAIGKTGKTRLTAPLSTARWQQSEPDPKIAKVYSNLARMEEAHIAFWEDRLRSAGEKVGERRPSWRSRVIAWIARRLGPDAVLSTIAAKEAADRNVYVKQPETSGTRMSSQEQWHTRVLGQLLRTQPQGLSGSFLGRLEGRHRAVGGNALARRRARRE